MVVCRATPFLLPPAKQRSLALKAYKAALARTLAEKAEREQRVALLSARLGEERRRLRNAANTIATLSWSITSLEGSVDVGPSPDRHRVTPLPRGAMAEGAMDIMRESDGRWLSPEEVAREVFRRFGIRRPSSEMVEAGSASAAVILRRFGRDGLAEHDGGSRPRRWRLLRTD